VRHTLTPVPVLTETAPDRFAFRYRDVEGSLLPPHLVLRWDDDGSTWVVEDGQGRPFRGTVRRLLLAHLREAFAAAFSPRVQASLDRAIDSAALATHLLRREDLDALAVPA
jgi:hypothetical protein